jgi:hypothetical protein
MCSYRNDFDFDIEEAVWSQLEAVQDVYPDCVVPDKFKTEDGFALGNWCSNRRKDYKKSRLSQERIDALEALGFVWDQLEEDFQEALGYLKTYKAEHGDCRVPHSFKTEDRFTLGSWCHSRRTEYEKGQLSQEHIDALEALGFLWDPLEEDFQEALGYLKGYKAEHGDCRVPHSFKTDDGFRLGSWCRSRRAQYPKGRLSQERIDALEALGFIWDLREEDYQRGLGYLWRDPLKRDQSGC